MNPMLASDWDPAKVKFPVIIQPKIDGVRGWNPDGRFLARSMKPHENRFTTAFFSEPYFKGLDGELAAERGNHPRLCSLTSSAASTHTGEPYMLWWCFDLINSASKGLCYEDRLMMLDGYVAALKTIPNSAHKAERLRVITWQLVRDMEELMYWHGVYAKEGFEGSILRDPHGMHKQGRSTPTEGGLLRIKDFADAEGVVIGLEEGQTNLNEAKVNARGQTERSTHKINMLPNGMVGHIIVRTLADIPVNNGKKIIPKGTIAKVAAGKLTHEQRKEWWDNREQTNSKIVKFQHFPNGVKDALRFPTFQSVRSPVDL